MHYIGTCHCVWYMVSTEMRISLLMRQMKEGGNELYMTIIVQQVAELDI